MSQLILKWLPDLFINTEINFQNKINQDNQEVLIEFSEYLHDFIYSNKAEFDKNPECVEKKDFLKMISKYR